MKMISILLTLVISICPGRFFAERVGQQFAAAVASTYHIKPVEGDDISKPPEFDDGLVRYVSLSPFYMFLA